MTEPALKPWLLETEEAEGAVAECRTVDAGAESGSGYSEAGTHAGENRRWTSYLALSPYWSCIPLAGAVGWGAWAFFRAGASGGLSHGSALGVIVLASISVAMMAASWIGRKAAMSRMISAFQHGISSSRENLRNVPISTDLRPIWSAVEEHAEHIERRLKELLDSHRHVSLELTLAGAQRRLIGGILTSLPDPLFVIDSYGQIQHTNRAAEGIFGFQHDERDRMPFDNVISQDCLRKSIQQARDADLRAAERRVEVVIGEQHFGAHIVPFTATEKTDDPNAGHGLIVMLRDITREREASRKKSEFVAHVAHELRTPLASIRAYVEMLVDGEASDEDTRKEYYDIIQTSAERLGRLIDNMLNISRIEAGTVRINKKPIAVSMVVKEACDVMRPSAEEKKIALAEELTPVMFRVLADRDLLYQSVLNLISNAVKYTPEGGQITVRMTPREESQSILIEVQDTGVGIPKEDLPRMFQKFFRVEANKNMAKGTGLGLNLVKNIVETVHGGQMTLASEVGKGSTFGMALPLMT